MAGETKKRNAKVASKLCIKCNRVLPLSQFYPNKSWQLQSYHDVWCRECAVRLCKNKKTVQQYCYDNNRVWKDTLWESATKKAQYTLATDPEYIDPGTTSTKRAEIEEACTARQFFSIMNLANFYGYVDNNAIPSNDNVFDGMDDEPEQRRQSSAPHYSTKWRGYFTDEEEAALDDLYAQYEEDFKLDNVNIRDYARKVCKASLNADIMEDKVRRGIASAGEYKEAQKIFDDLSKSSNFAACRKQPGDSSGLGSLGEIILRLETSGALNDKGFTFPEDDVDKIIKDFRHTLVAVGLEGQL